MRHCKGQKTEVKTLKISICAVFFALSMMGCQGLDLAQTPLKSIQLSGIWVVDAGASDDLRAFTRPPSERRRPKLSVREEIRRIGLGSGLAFVVQDFQIIDANQIVIEQGRNSMGVKHIPGTYRDVTWGDRERDIWRIQAGWQETDLVIFSTAKGLRVLERYQLVNQNRLRLDLDVQADGVNRKLTRFFDRKS
jgi:hypothetical protein